MEYEHYLALARANLADVEFQAELAVGRAMSQEQALAYAQNFPVKQEITAVNKENSDSLTNREREVAALVGLGKTNGEIATELVLSKRTVETHISNILSKLGLTSRAQIMLWAIDRNLT
jgi:non-specific serine/threonine protein kinase